MTNKFYGPKQFAIPGTTVRSKQFNGNNEEIVAGFDKLQDPDALASGSARYGIDTGNIENQYEVTIDFKDQVNDYIPGMELTFKTARSNSGPCQLVVNGFSPKLILSSDGFNLSTNQIAENSIIEVTYDGSAFRVKNINYREIKFDINEQVELSDLQTTVTFKNITTSAAAFYVEGDLVDRGRLVLNRDYTVTSTKTIELKNTYPTETVILGVLNEGNTSDYVFEGNAEAVFNRNVVPFVPTTEYKKYIQNGRTLTPLLMHDAKLYLPLNDIGNNAYIFTADPVVVNGDETITVKTNNGDLLFSKESSEAVSKLDQAKAIGAALGYNVVDFWSKNKFIPKKSERVDGYALLEPLSGKIIIPLKNEEFTTGNTFQNDLDNGYWHVSNHYGRVNPVTGALRTALDVVNRSLRVSDMEGATGTAAEQTQAINNAMSIAVSLFFGELFVDGQYLYEGTLTLPEGLVMRGRNYQTYGEFYRANPSRITFSNVNAGNWALQFPVGKRPLTITDMDFEGDWIMNGLQFMGSNREITIERVSIKKFEDCFETNGMWASKIDNLRLTGRGNLFSWMKGGTAVNLGSIIAQGDKQNKIHAKTCYRFGGSASTAGFNFLNSTGTKCLAGQYAEIGCEMTEDCQISHDCFDLEEIEDSLFYFYDTNQCRVVINSPYLGATDSTKSFFKFRGTIGTLTQIELTNPAMIERFLKTPTGPDWRSTLFIDNNATFESGASFIVPESLAVNAGALDHMTNNAPVVQGFIRIRKNEKATTERGLILTGAKSYIFPAAFITDLYNEFYAFNPVTTKIIRPDDAKFGISYPFKLASTHYTVGALYPEIAYFTLRRAGDDSAFVYAPVSFGDTMPHHITMTYDQSADEVTITTESESQEIFITIA